MVLSSSNTPRLFIITDRKDEKELQLSPNDQDWEGKLGITMDIYPLYNECAADCVLTAVAVLQICHCCQPLILNVEENKTKQR